MRLVKFTVHSHAMCIIIPSVILYTEFRIVCDFDNFSAASQIRISLMVFNAPNILHSSPVVCPGLVIT
jgi:hypothetical protein